MKRKLQIIAIFITFLFLAGCGKKTNENNIDYFEFSSIVRNPDSVFTSSYEAGKWEKAFTFTGAVISEVYEMSSEADADIAGKKFIEVVIARQLGIPIFIEVEGIETLPDSEIISVTGELLGSIYYTVDGEIQDCLHIKASKLEAVIPADGSNTKADVLQDINQWVEYKLLKAVRIPSEEEGEPDSAAILFELHNKESVTMSATLSDFFVEQDNTILRKNFSVRDFEAGSDYVDTYTHVSKGMKANSYEVYKLENDSNEITVSSIDDDFNVIFSQTLVIE